MQKVFTYIPTTLILGLGLAVLLFLYRQGGGEAPVASAKESGEMIVLTVNGPTTYFEDASGEFAGLEHDLAEDFANELGLKLRFEVLASESELISALEARRGHIAAGTLLPTPAREKRVRFGSAYQTISQQVMYRKGQPKPRDVKDLAGKRIGVLAASHHAERLAELRDRIPGLVWQEFNDDNPDELFRRLSDGSLDFVIADSNWFTLSRHFYPDVELAFPLGKAEPLAWAFPFSGDEFLYKAAQQFFARVQKDGTLKRLLARYYDDTRKMSRIDVAAFTEDAQTLLPRYRAMFEAAADATGIDWRLIAAIGYQESHWDPHAESPTGVRGLMMLTEETATRVKLKNLLDPAESIMAGAKYLVLLKEGVPERIAEPDRTWLALAAYNQGLGHLEDARILAQRLKKSPDTWADVKAALPLLSDPQHHVTLKHGYARGAEAVAMTDNVRTYFDLLARLEKTRPPPVESGAADSGEQP